MQLFDEKPEWLKKAQGQKVSAISHGLCLETARRLAVSHAKLHGVVSIDEVRDGLICEGYDLSIRPKWLGSVFLTDEFVPAGFKKAEHIGSHGRIIRLWQLKDKIK